MNAPLLARRPLYEEVAERVRQQIFDRQLEPGSWIDELRLAGELGISRTPLREALKVLATEGLITMKPRRGAYVSEPSPGDVAQVYHLLAVLESDAAGEVARRHDAQALGELLALHQQLEAQVQDRDAFFATNEAFHFKLLELAGNRWRTQIVSDLRKVMKLNRHHSLFKKGRISASLSEHRMIMEALKAGKAEAATEAMRRHFQNSLASTSESAAP